MYLDYLSWLAVVLRWIHRNVDICQTDYSIPSKLGSSSYLEVIKGGKKVQVKGTLIQV